MSESALAVMDSGEANRRILSKDEYRADFRRVEAASLKRKTSLASGEGKRIFARCFYTFQAGMYFVSTLGRTKLPRESIEQIELAVRTKLEAAAKEVDKVIDGAELLLKQNSIEAIATYDTVPLDIEIGITSALGRRYFELIHKLDQAMPLIQTLEIEEVITEKAAEHQRSNCKRIVLSLASTVRNFSSGVRRRMNEADAKKLDGDERATGRHDPVNEAPGTDGLNGGGQADGTVPASTVTGGESLAEVEAEAATPGESTAAT